MDDVFVWVDYCDDVRQEVGNKISLIGCYGPDLLVPSFPAVLPKLCVVAKIIAPVRPLASGMLRVFRGDQLIGEMPVKAVEKIELPPHKQDAKFQVLQGILIMSPFSVEAPSRLSVKFESDDGEVEGPRLHINSPDQIVNNATAGTAKDQ